MAESSPEVLVPEQELLPPVIDAQAIVTITPVNANSIAGIPDSSFVVDYDHFIACPADEARTGQDYIPGFVGWVTHHDMTSNEKFLRTYVKYVPASNVEFVITKGTNISELETVEGS